MNESILKALMRLFAIVADANKYGSASNEREIVMDYLDRQYSHELVQTFLEYFDEQVKLYHPEQMFQSDDAIKQQIDINESKIIELCNQINIELEQEQKMIVLIYLLDFINSDNRVTEHEMNFVTSFAHLLKIRKDEFQDAKAFSFGKIDEVVDKDQLLFIDNNASFTDPDIKHILSEKIHGQITVLHLASTNTFVFRYYGNSVLLLNGHNIKQNRSYIWSLGSVIRSSKIGTLYYSWMAGKFIQANIESKFVFTAEEIEYNYRNSTNGVKRFNFSEESGRLIGIIGGSGSGKSTLLNILNGNIKPRNGTIKINGFDIHEQKEQVKGVIGYVPQDDLLIKELSVFQNLYINAELCFSYFNKQQLTALVEKALVDFDLVEARDLNVGDAFTTILSGGQRKRLNIALELIREPSILFVDEPTSGLSSADSEKVIILLKRQTLKGKLVIANIHQPSSDVFKMLDKLLIMDQGGRIIYYGHPVSAVTYFKRAAQFADAEESECLSCGNINTDQILRIIESRMVDVNGRLTRKRKTSPQEWYDKYMTEVDPIIKQIKREHDASIPKSNFNIPGHFQQFKIFLQRDILAKIKNRQYLLLNAIEAPLLAVILAYFTKNFNPIDGVPTYIFGNNPNIPAFLFMAVIVSLFLGLVVSAEEIFKDRKILKREKFLNLSRSSYLFSKITILFSLSAIQALLFVIIGNSMLEINGMLFRYWLVLFTTSCCANLVGLNISAGLNSVVTIYILVPLILVPQLLFSGVVVDFNTMHNKIASKKNVPLIGDMMTSRWAYEALMVTQFKDNRFEKIFYTTDQQINNAIYYKSFAIPQLKNYARESNEIYQSLGDTLQLSKNLTILHKEIRKVCSFMGSKKPSFTDSLTVKLYSNQIDTELIQFITNTERHFIYLYNAGIAKRDKLYDTYVTKFGRKDKFFAFKQQYYNKYVADIVTNNKEFIEFQEYNGEFYRNKDAIFRLPESVLGRAHFYAPYKRVHSLFIDTFFFNVMIIWLFTAIMLIFLYYDVLRKIITYFEILRLNRANRRRLLRLIKIADGAVSKK